MPHLSAIPVLDLFAGPGGLGEGFSSLKTDQGEAVFKIALSIEMTPVAHQTLMLRSFVRHFPDGLPSAYYEFLRQDKPNLDTLFEQFPKEAGFARAEAWQATLGGTPHSEVKARMTNALTRKKSGPLVLIGGPPCQAPAVSHQSSTPHLESATCTSPEAVNPEPMIALDCNFTQPALPVKQWLFLRTFHLRR
jgi:DNA (cytosine-5)-methyltransferase 1